MMQLLDLLLVPHNDRLALILRSDRPDRSNKLIPYSFTLFIHSVVCVENLHL